jgi:precorrin-2 dehydrogenase/sirohydrochlorin ferrochelatase
MQSGVPLLLNLDHRRVVVVGGGPVAEAKVLSLRTGGSPEIHVVAPELTVGLRELADQGVVIWEPRPFEPHDLDTSWLVVAATNIAEVNAAVVRAADECRIWCVRADLAEEGSAGLIAAVREGPLLIAVSTTGTAPALASYLRSELATLYGPEWGEFASILGELRQDPEIRRTMSAFDSSERRRRWRAVIRPDIVELVRSGRRITAKEVAAACLCSSSD